MKIKDIKLGKYYWYNFADERYPVKVMGKDFQNASLVEDYLIVQCHCKICRQMVGTYNICIKVSWLERRLSILEKILIIGVTG